MLVSSTHWEGCREGARSTGEGCSGSDETVIEGVGICSGSGEGGEISVRVTDNSVGVEMEGDVAGGSDGAEIRRDEVPSNMTGEMELDSTEVGGKIRSPNPPLREESAEAGPLKIGPDGTSRRSGSRPVGDHHGMIQCLLEAQ